MDRAHASWTLRCNAFRKETATFYETVIRDGSARPIECARCCYTYCTSAVLGC